jgi:hypothetical protein
LPRERRPLRRKSGLFRGFGAVGSHGPHPRGRSDTFPMTVHPASRALGRRSRLIAALLASILPAVVACSRNCGNPSTTSVDAQVIVDACRGVCQKQAEADAAEARPEGGREASRCVFRWKWPDPRFTDECRVLICRSRPSDGGSPEEAASVPRIRKFREPYQSAGGYDAQQIDPAWKGAYVVVRARVDLGADVPWSEPLVPGKV